MEAGCPEQATLSPFPELDSLDFLATMHIQKTNEQSVGSVLADKIHEPLDALLKVYEARLKPLETMEDRWRNYPDVALESR